MKNSIPSLVILCASVVILNACYTSKDSVTAPKSDSENLDKATSSCFVIMADGSTRNYTNLRLVTGVLVTPHLVADNNTAIYAKDVLAYQDGHRYAVSQKLLSTKKTSYVAAETLPGFAVRITKGKLNIYSRKYYNGNTTVTEYFLQSGDEGEIIAFSPDLMKEMIKDNNRAIDYYNSKVKNSTNSKKLLVAVDIYNNPTYISKN